MDKLQFMSDDYLSKRITEVQRLIRESMNRSDNDFTKIILINLIESESKAVRKIVDERYSIENFIVSLCNECAFGDPSIQKCMDAVTSLRENGHIGWRKL